MPGVGGLPRLLGASVALSRSGPPWFILPSGPKRVKTYCSHSMAPPAWEMGILAKFGSGPNFENFANFANLGFSKLFCFSKKARFV